MIKKRFVSDFVEKDVLGNYYQTKNSIGVWSRSSYSTAPSSKYTLVPVLLDMAYIKRSGKVVSVVSPGVIKGANDYKEKHRCKTKEELIDLAEQITKKQSNVVPYYPMVTMRGNQVQKVSDIESENLPINFTNEKLFKEFAKIIKGKNVSKIDYRELANKSAEGKATKIVEHASKYSYVNYVKQNVIASCNANLIYKLGNGVEVYEMRGKTSRLVVSNSFAYIEYYDDGSVNLLYNIEKGNSKKDAAIVAKKLNNKLVSLFVSIMDLRREPLLFFQSLHSGFL